MVTWLCNCILSTHHDLRLTFTCLLIFCLLPLPELDCLRAGILSTSITIASPASTTVSLIHYQFSSVAQSCPTLCDCMDFSTPGLPVYHQLLEFTQTHVHWVCDAIQPSHPLLSPSPPAFNLSQHQRPFQWVSSSHQVAKVLEFQLQHQSFQWTLRTDLL